jgi:hypothetical protein
MNRDPLQPAQVYRLYDRNGRLLYCGVSLCCVSRAAKHRIAAPWFADVATIQVTHYRRWDDARAAEIDAIQNEHPAHNRHHRGPDLRSLQYRAKGEGT